MLTLVNTEVENDNGDKTVVKRYSCDFVAECDGSSIWSGTAEKKVRVTGITVVDRTYADGEDAYTEVYVEHDAGWEIYTDRGFERAISAALGFAVGFTEQGMQEDNMASMEA